jgi:hypothetical protein
MKCECGFSGDIKSAIEVPKGEKVTESILIDASESSRWIAYYSASGSKNKICPVCRVTDTIYSVDVTYIDGTKTSRKCRKKNSLYELIKEFCGNKVKVNPQSKYFVSFDGVCKVDISVDTGSDIKYPEVYDIVDRSEVEEISEDFGSNLHENYINGSTVMHKVPEEQIAKLLVAEKEMEKVGEEYVKSAEETLDEEELINWKKAEEQGVKLTEKEKEACEKHVQEFKKELEEKEALEKIQEAVEEEENVLNWTKVNIANI